MKVEIIQHSLHPTDTLLEVYNNDGFLICRIYEDDFSEILSDNQLTYLENGETIFDIDYEELLTHAKTIF